MPIAAASPLSFLRRRPALGLLLVIQALLSQLLLQDLHAAVMPLRTDAVAAFCGRVEPARLQAYAEQLTPELRASLLPSREPARSTPASGCRLCAAVNGHASLLPGLVSAPDRPAFGADRPATGWRLPLCAARLARRPPSRGPPVRVF